MASGAMLSLMPLSAKCCFTLFNCISTILLYLVSCKRIEHDDLVNTVKEFRTYCFSKQIIELFSCLCYHGIAVVIIKVLQFLLYNVRTEVRCHNNYCISEIGCPSLVISKPSFIKTCNSILNTSGCAFSISSRSTTE